MKLVDVHEAETCLSELLGRIEAGEEIVIARSGQPIAHLVPIVTAERRPGRLRHKIRIAQSFDDPIPENLLAGL